MTISHEARPRPKVSWKIIGAIVVVVIVAIGAWAGYNIKPETPKPYETGKPYPSGLTSATQFSDRTGIPFRPVGARLINIADPTNVQSILNKVFEEGSFMLFNPEKPEEFQVFDSKKAEELLGRTKFEEFKTAYMQYLSSITTVGDKLVVISWEGPVNFASMGLWSSGDAYKFDSAMHWNILVQVETPQFVTGSSVEVIWPFLIGRYAWGLGIAYNFTLYARASGDGSHILDRLALWVSDFHDGVFELVEKSISEYIVSPAHGVEAVRFIIKVKLIWKVGLDHILCLFWARSHSREGFLDLSANDTWDWGPKVIASVNQTPSMYKASDSLLVVRSKISCEPKVLRSH